MLKYIYSVSGQTEIFLHGTTLCYIKTSLDSQHSLERTCLCSFVFLLPGKLQLWFLYRVSGSYCSHSLSKVLNGEWLGMTESRIILLIGWQLKFIFPFCSSFNEMLLLPRNGTNRSQELQWCKDFALSLCLRMTCKQKKPTRVTPIPSTRDQTFLGWHCTLDHMTGYKEITGP